MWFTYIFLAKSYLQLYVFSDDEWAGDSINKLSITFNCFFLKDSLLSWRSKKQTVVSRSSSNTEVSIEP